MPPSLGNLGALSLRPSPDWTRPTTLCGGVSFAHDTDLVHRHLLATTGFVSDELLGTTVWPSGRRQLTVTLTQEGKLKTAFETQ